MVICSRFANRSTLVGKRRTVETREAQISLKNSDLRLTASASVQDLITVVCHPDTNVYERAKVFFILVSKSTGD